MTSAPRGRLHALARLAEFASSASDIDESLGQIRHDALGAPITVGGNGLGERRDLSDPHFGIVPTTTMPTTVGSDSTALILRYSARARRGRKSSRRARLGKARW